MMTRLRVQASPEINNFLQYNNLFYTTYIQMCKILFNTLTACTHHKS
ncbi:hypothetical protein AGNV_035 [Anticarsia gemmatalis multiple nucleopolyhedrovirus]|uniref:Uncharacterized protein n=1 Tax=Anticarsia gemmatalis multiple nucleopolyhedrovirus TaxID=268591 RepID=A0A0S3IZS0_9ABAC|nr:hypothetical protein AGNV_035 [Anticarsia gemmatalis nucleopolyhedrovirus]YP_009316052.1 hypothetical protein AGNV_035 [Anticarsia gemmatalis multiple nucleopolyhedrovirus]AKJ32597.1 hypothetical protein AGNV_035 [Anticarsia gemmatalis multiple nucleopolyhedrovirus]ALR69842.1 hypothetical protein AGNV_035 [Anticarsia gemmatalis multiple nucleopolyhedrovirus]ALR70000.1 hypothetical protein AGNV_035 [Anticarsia gemmatalis multiple nucleopolyhedrovirus]ALR70157.1 hypothetical protein AGNV_035 